MFVSDSHMYLTEVPFYDQLRPRLDLETPAVYACDLDRETYPFALVIEAVSLRSTSFPSALTGLNGDDLAPLMDTLAALHAPNWGRRDLKGRSPRALDYRTWANDLAGVD
jgi:hypothetical protein